MRRILSVNNVVKNVLSVNPKIIVLNVKEIMFLPK